MEKEPVLSIVPSPLIPPVTGGQKHTYGLLNALGKIATVVSITDSKSSTAGHTFDLQPLIEHKLRKYLSFGNYKLILRKVKQLKPKAILLEQPFMGFIINIIAKKTNTPFYIHAHNVEFLRYKSLGKWWWPLVYVFEKHAFTKARGIFFITEEDRQLAISKLNTPGKKTFISPYGIPLTKKLDADTVEREQIRAKLHIGNHEKVFMFFGDLKYLPNIEALEIIINEIMPRLKEAMTTPYKILICGGGLSGAYQKQLREYDKEHLIYAGFVPNIDEYTRSADVVLNPVLNRGGIRTKVIEALGFNKNVVTTVTGAFGVDKRVCGEKLFMVENDDWDAFTQHLIKATEIDTDIPPEFFSKYGWHAIAQELLQTLEDH